MEVDIKRIDKDLDLPVYETEGSVGFDLVVREGVTVNPGEIELIPCNVVVDTPKGYMLLLALRSSTPRKYPGLIKPHSVGIVDWDYSGDDDEIMLQVQNIGVDPIEVDRGESIGQGIFVKVAKADFNEVEEMDQESRGGFGSTDEN